jgi:hypothetical protein
MSCGCQKRTAPDGKIGCSLCIATLSKQSKQAMKQTTQANNSQNTRWEAIAAKFKK